MKISKKQLGFSKKLLVISILSAFGTVHAEDDDVAYLTQPHSSISIGVGQSSGIAKDRTILDQYNGLRKNNSSVLLDFNIIKRDDAAGLWTTFQGNNIGLDNRDVSFSQNKQGDWKYSVSYSELVRHDPRTINTGLQGDRSNTPTVQSLATPGSGTDLNLDIKRAGVGLGAEKWLTPNLMFEVNAKEEARTGSRLSGVGVACMPPGFSSISCSGMAAGMLMLPAQIDARTKQIEAKLNYTGEKFLVTGGYYGSFYDNSNGSMNPSISGNLVNPDGTILNTGTTPGSTLAGYLQQPIASAPDNQAHQFYVSGNYSFSQTTHANFKYSHTRATQRDSFSSNGLTSAPAGVTSLGGAIDTDLAQLGITARPTPKLSLLANIRLEDKVDKTPLALYDGTYTNDTHTLKNSTGKVEAGYQLPDNLRAMFGIDYATVHRDGPLGTAAVLNPTIAVPPLTGMRNDTEEIGYRAELRRSMSETFNAGISFVESKRDGGGWLSIGTANPVGTYPMTMQDRKRDKVKLSADWMPTNKLSLQFMLEDGKDTYTGPTAKGLRETGMSSYGIDAAFVLTDAWKLTGYANQGTQTLHVDHYAGYLAELKNDTINLDIGVVGKPSSKLEVGGDWSYLNDRNRYHQTMASGTAIIGEGLPDVTYRVTSLKLYGKYALQKESTIRIDLVHQNVSFNEWTWGYNGKPFTYSDNTTVTMQPNQSVNYLGASYIYQY
jgi:MtrB/PioB family decaheme-associated outer membrane protein